MSDKTKNWLNFQQTYDGAVAQCTAKNKKLVSLLTIEDNICAGRYLQENSKKTFYSIKQILCNVLYPKSTMAHMFGLDCPEEENLTTPHGFLEIH
jgi:hypothetical protein